MPGQRTLAIDFDGVFNLYVGWQGSENPPDPKPGIRDFLQNATAAHHNFRIIISTCRDVKEVNEWLQKHDLAQYVSHVTNQKPIAWAYIDDRGIQFNGNFVQLLDDIEAFQPYWQKSLPQL